MSFKSEAANVRAGIASGGYKKKSDPFAGFFDELVGGLKRSDAAKRQEALEEKRETRAENRRIKAAQDAAEKVAKDQTKLARFWLTSNSNIENNPQTQAAVLSAVKQGNFTDFSGLNEFMKAQSAYVPGQTGEPVVNQAEFETLVDGGMVTQTDDMLKALKPVARNPDQRTDTDGTLVDVTPKIANPEDTTGRIEFGEQPVAFELAGLTETNWSGTLADEKAKEVPNVKAIAAIEAWATNEGYVNIIPGYTLKELNTKSLEELLEIQGSIPTTNASAVSSMDAVVAVKKVTEDNKQIFMKPEELIAKDASFLTMALGTLTPDSPKYNNVVNALALRTSMDSSVSLAEASANLAGDENYYRKAIAAYGVLDASDGSYAANLESLRKLNILLAFEVDKTNAEGLDTDKSRTVKQTALEAFYIANEFFVKAAEGKAVKVPSVADMAKFETSWKKLTDISKEPESWFSDANLMKMSVEDLQVLRDTDILKGKTVALTNVTAILDKRIEVQAATKLSEKLDPSNRSFKDTNELDQFVSGLGIDRIDDDALADFARVRGVLARQQGILEADEDVNAYQVALKAHLMLPANKGKTGQDLINVMTNWETTWKDGTAATPADKAFNSEFVAGEIFKANQLLSSTDPTKQAEGKAFLDNTLPNMMKGLVGVNSTTLTQEAKLAFLIDSGVEQGLARAMVGGTTEIVKDAVTGEQSLVNFDRLDVSVPASYQAETMQIVQDMSAISANGFTTDVNGQTVTITPQEIKDSKVFLNRVQKPGGNLPISKAFGSGSWLANIASEGTAIVGWETFPELTQMNTYIENLNNSAMRMISVAIAGSKDSVFNKQAIMETLPKPTTFFENKKEAKSKLMGAVQELTRAFNAQEATLAPEARTTPSAKSKAYVMKQSLKPLLDAYTNLLAEWNASEQAAKVPISSNLQLTETVSTGNKPAATSTLTESGVAADGTKIYTFGGSN